MKRIILILALAVMALALAGCGSDSGSGSYTVEGINDSVLPAPFVQNGEDGVKVATIAQAGLTAEDFAAAYYDTCFEDGDVAHYIVNFSTNTTTEIRVIDGQVFVTTMEYVDGEEHDYKEIGTGMVYSEYLLHTDTGEMENLLE